MLMSTVSRQDDNAAGAPKRNVKQSPRSKPKAAPRLQRGADGTNSHPDHGWDDVIARVNAENGF